MAGQYVLTGEQPNARPSPSPCALGRGDEGGFTLVEAIVALAILALSLSVLLGVISNGIRQTAHAENAAEAASLAQSLLAEVGAEVPLRPGQTDGQFTNGFHWRLRMETYSDAADSQQWPVNAYRVSAEVFWDDGLEGRSVVLTTLRLGPKAPTR